jgi:hypothetical protein
LVRVAQMIRNEASGESLAFIAAEQAAAFWAADYHNHRTYRM